MSGVSALTNELFARLGMEGVDADLTVTDHTDIPEVDDTVIVLGELSVSELKTFGALRRAIDSLDALHKRAMAAALHTLADKLDGGTPVAGGMMFEVDRDELMGAALTPAIREEFVRHNTLKDAAKSVLFLSMRQRLNYWGFGLEVRRGGNICIPRNPETN